MRKLFILLVSFLSLGAIAQEKPFDTTYGMRAKHFRGMNLKSAVPLILYSTATGKIDTLPRGTLGQALKWGASGIEWGADNAGGTTINNNAANRLITGSGTSGTLEANSNATWNSTNFSLGSTSSSSTATPVNINLGGTYGNSVANSLKFKLYDDGAGGTYGFGVSSLQMNYKTSSNIVGHFFYGGTDLYATINADGLTLPALGSTGNRLVGRNSSSVLYETSLDPANIITTSSTINSLAAPGASFSMNSQKITGLADGTTSTDAVNKSQLDAVTAGLTYKTAAVAATTTAGTLATSFEDGDAIDGVTLATGDRILIKDQAAPAENGIYTVNASGAPTRATDFDASADITSGSAVSVTSGTTNANTLWVQTTTGTITVGTTAIVFAQITTPLSDNSVTNAKLTTGIDAAKLADGSVTNTELQYINTLSSNAQTQLNTLTSDVSAKQDGDADLTAIAGLSPTNDDIIQRKSGAWANRTMAQLKTDLALTKTDVGLSNVANVDQQNASNLTSGTVAAARLGSGTTSAYNSLRGDQTYKTDWITLVKAADESRNTNATLTADNTLSFAMLANTKYSIRIKVYFETAATPDFKYGLTGPASPTFVRLVRKHVDPAALTTLVTASEVAYTSSVSVAGGAGTTGGYVEMDITVSNGSNAANFSFMWAQNTSNGGSTTVKAGSYLEYTSN